MRANRRNVFIAGGVAAALLVLLGVGIWYQFFRDDAPPRVSLADAVESIATSGTSTGTPAIAVASTSAVATATISDPTATTAETMTAAPAGDDGTATTIATAETTEETTETETAEPGTEPTVTATIQTASASGLDGSWAVADGTKSFVGYRIGEELATIGTTEAVGRTAAIESSVTITNGTLTAASIIADMTSLESDESRRDNALANQGLETNAFPTATFELTEPVILAESLADGEAASIDATGRLTLHGVTQPVQIPLDVQLTNGVLIVVGSLDITLIDYGIEKPSAPIVASVNDAGVLELQLFLNPVS